MTEDLCCKEIKKTYCQSFCSFSEYHFMGFLNVDILVQCTSQALCCVVKRQLLRAQNPESNRTEITFVLCYVVWGNVFNLSKSISSVRK